MKRIINLCFNLSPLDNETVTFNIFQESFTISKIGTDFNADLLLELVDEYYYQCDVISIRGLPDPVNYKGKTYYHFIQKEIIKKYGEQNSVVYGQQLRDIYVPYFIRNLAKSHGEFFKYKGLAFPCSLIQRNHLESFEQLSKKFICADPYFIFNIAQTITSRRKLDYFHRGILHFAQNSDLKKMSKRDFSLPQLKAKLSDFAEAEVLVLNETQLNYLEFDDLTGKTVILDGASEHTKAYLRELGVNEIISCFPNLNLPEKFDNFISFSNLEAIFVALLGSTDPLTFDDIFPFIERYNLYPNLPTTLISSQSKKSFAFLIHPLSTDHYFLLPGAKNLKNVPGLATTFEKAFPLLPGIHIGKIMNIKSLATDQEVEGHIYATLETPGTLLKVKPTKFYDKVVKICHQAKNNGAEIFGLGAYTKIVGDAGVSIAKDSPIPVTTGNSLSAAAALWAANYGVTKMNFVSKIDDIYQGSAMIVGATGSIGKVSAKILAKKWKRVILIAPKPYKLMELKNEIESIAPHCHISISANADHFLEEADLIITTTSNQGKKVLDISKVKPGAVICDIGRPFDVSESEMITRPDVLFIAGGEVELPGDNVILNCDIGLHGNVVYACLAETALLALENRLETFSLSRDLDYNKVQEIDAMARKHGVRLAAIMGHSAEITDNEIALCRSLALEKLNPLDVEIYTQG